MLDDSLFVADAWKMAGDDEGFACHTYQSPEELVACCRHDPAFLSHQAVIILDLHLGDATLDGIEVARRLRTGDAGWPRYDGPIILATDALIRAKEGDALDAVVTLVASKDTIGLKAIDTALAAKSKTSSSRSQRPN